MGERLVRLVLPHQLFRQHLEAPAATTFVLVEHDLLLRQYSFHAQKLVLHRASMTRFADRLRDAGFAVEHITSDGRTTSRAALDRVLERLRPTRVSVYDVVDDWLWRDLAPVVDEVLETPGFLTSRAEVDRLLRGRGARMQHFYQQQRRRLGVLMDGDGPEGGRWSFDAENRKRLPRGYDVPEVQSPARHPAVEDAIEWVRERFPDAPGDPSLFHWPTSHEEAEAAYEDFLVHRFAGFGPFEDAISAHHPFLHHSLISPSLNSGLLDPHDVLTRALDHEGEVPLASMEGFVRQVIGWREYMRASYVTWGPQLRTRNRLAHARPLAPGWWDATTGLAPVDLVVRRVLDHAYCHHIERLMVLGNAMCLLRTDPDAVYEWFMEMFVDAYDWVMVPNVYAMSQFAAGDAITTKPYVSGSNYLRTMSDLPAGEWHADWDALYWTFVRDQRDLFAANPRSRMVARLYDGLDPATKARHTRRAAAWLGG